MTDDDEMYDLALEVTLSGLSAPIAAGHTVTVGEAVRAYLALEDVAAHRVGMWKRAIGTWDVVPYDVAYCVAVDCPTLADAILTAAQPDTRP